MTVDVHPAPVFGSADEPETPLERVEFSLVRGGPLDSLLRRVGLVRGEDLDAGRQSIAFVALTWAPLMVLAIAGRYTDGRWDPFVRDFSVHARLLIAVPLLFFGDNVLHVLTGHAVERFAQERIAADPADVRRAVDGARRLRDALAPEVVCALLAVTVGLALYWNHSGPAGLLGSSATTATHTPLTLWYSLVALPLTQLVFLRWLWRWFIWSRFVWQLSRLEGELAPLHPDRRGGVGFLGETTTGFAAGVAAFSFVQCGAWLSRIVFEGVPASAFFEPYWLLLVGVLLFTQGPLLAWSVRLWRLRHDGAKRFGVFSAEYARRFDRKWLESAPHPTPLGSSDIQSLADLSNSFAIVRELGIILVDRRTLLTMAVAVTAPLIPVILTQIPLVELLHRLTSVALGQVS